MRIARNGSTLFCLFMFAYSYAPGYFFHVNISIFSQMQYLLWHGGIDCYVIFVQDKSFEVKKRTRNRQRTNKMEISSRKI
jgi:hypothetical protein